MSKSTRETTDHPALVVRRNAIWSAPVGAAASAVAIAYLWRAIGTGGSLDWAFVVLLGALALTHLHALIDARTPMLVADEIGVRIRLGQQWRSLPWSAVDRVVVQPRRGRLRDGHLRIFPHNDTRVLDGLGVRARRNVALARKLYGAPLAVPLGLVTRVSAAQEKDIADTLAELAKGTADVVTVLPARPVESEATIDPGSDRGGDRGRGLGGDPSSARAPRRARPVLASVTGRVGRSRATLPAAYDLPQLPLAPAALTVPTRALRRGLRADIVLGAAAPDLAPEAAPFTPRLPEERHLRRAGSVDLVFEQMPEVDLRTIGVAEAAPDPVIEEIDPPVLEPVIGPPLQAARRRLGLSVDEVAERTRIRPHVIESIEVDDFSPCGGDVYARGHLRTLARLLGMDPAPVLESFEHRYASAPVSARRVFEAELATSTTGGIRGTVGGPAWNLLLGCVLTLLLVWGVVRLFAGGPNEMVEQPPPLPHGAHWPSNVYAPAKHTAPAARRVPLRLVALNAPTRVQVHDLDGNLLFDQVLVIGEVKTLRVPGHVKVWAADASALNVTFKHHDHGLLGTANDVAEKTF